MIVRSTAIRVNFERGSLDRMIFVECIVCTLGVPVFQEVTSQRPSGCDGRQDNQGKVDLESGGWEVPVG